MSTKTLITLATDPLALIRHRIETVDTRPRLQRIIDTLKARTSMDAPKDNPIRQLLARALERLTLDFPRVGRLPLYAQHWSDEFRDEDRIDHIPALDGLPMQRERREMHKRNPALDADLSAEREARAMLRYQRLTGQAMFSPRLSEARIVKRTRFHRFGRYAYGLPTTDADRARQAAQQARRGLIRKGNALLRSGKLTARELDLVLQWIAA